GGRAAPALEFEVDWFESVQCRVEAALLGVLVGSEVVQQRPWRQRVQQQAGVVEADTLAVIARVVVDSAAASRPGSVAAVERVRPAQPGQRAPGHLRTELRRPA